jgi:hypothetical protein
MIFAKDLSKVLEQLEVDLPLFPQFQHVLQLVQGGLHFKWASSEGSKEEKVGTKAVF